MHPGPAIRRLRKAKEWKLEQLAARIETHLGKPVNTGNLSRVEREGQGYSQEFLKAVALALGVGIDELFRHDDADVVLEDSQGAFAIAQAKTRARDDVLEIPRFENPISMGPGAERQEVDLLVGKMEINRKWVQQNLAGISSPKNLAVMVGFGDSMRPTIDDGDPMLVDRGVNDVRTDAIYVFTLSNELFIKTLQRLPGGAIKVISDNAKYPAYVVDAESKREMEVLARVVWAWNGRKL